MARRSSGGLRGGRSLEDPGRVRRAEGAHCTGAASGAAGGRAGWSAGHFLVQGHCMSVKEKKHNNFKKIRKIYLNDNWLKHIYMSLPGGCLSKSNFFALYYI